jgi:hypothetical protein
VNRKGVGVGVGGGRQLSGAAKAWEEFMNMCVHACKREHPSQTS